MLLIGRWVTEITILFKARMNSGSLASTSQQRYDQDKSTAKGTLSLPPVVINFLTNACVFGFILMTFHL
jgi:hypothetical protein